MAKKGTAESTPAKGREGADAAVLAHREATVLIARMRHEIEVLSAFLDEEEAELTRRSPTAKRVARLRLVGDDLTAAAGFVTKKAKRS